MRPIDRGPQPPVLASLVDVEPDRKWDSGGQGEVHDAIKDCLRSAQQHLCAYCEQPLFRRGQVEHIHPQKADAPCTKRPNSFWHYDWTNLLLVCGSNAHCDGPKADSDWCAEVLFPDEMSPGVRYFTVNSLDGELSPANDLSDSDLIRATLAIKALALNHPSLKKLRLNIIEQLQQDLSDPDQAKFARHRAQCNGFPTTTEAFLA